MSDIIINIDDLNEIENDSQNNINKLIFNNIFNKINNNYISYSSQCITNNIIIKELDNFDNYFCNTLEKISTLNKIHHFIIIILSMIIMNH